MIKFYQYRSAEITKIILKDSTLKFTNPMDFNDPFDFHPTVPDVGFNKFIKRVNGQYSNKRKKYRLGHKELITHRTKLRSEDFRRVYTENFSIACFSKSPFILPMWAHYADDHQGCVIEFKFEETEGFIEEFIKEGANKQVISSQADSLIKISRIWADFFPANNRISLFRLFFPPFLALFPVFTEISPTDVSFGPPETGWPG